MNSLRESVEWPAREVWSRYSITNMSCCTHSACPIRESRCPSDVVCITAGDVVMVLAFSGAGNARTDTLRLFTAPKSSTYGGFLFTPLKVLPYPRTGGPNVPKTLTLHVTDAP